ncbi:MAG: cytochrome C [Bacteroidetes bacterium]|nr:cytochrome C [Bacteroidota bacterium]
MGLKKNVGIVVIALIAIIVVGTLYVALVLPNIPAPEIQVEATPDRIEKGKYLANHVAVCIDCHSSRDWDKYSGPPIPGSEGEGGEKFARDFGLPGIIYVPNITPFNLRDWSDGEIYRAITSGVDREDNFIMPVMPYHNYSRMDTEDIFSIIAYIKTLSEKPKEVPKSEIDFPVNIYGNLFTKKPEPAPRPDKQDKVKYGKYLVNAAGCIDCHTPFSEVDMLRVFAFKMSPFEHDAKFSGGMRFESPFGTVVSANITPDKGTGIGDWSEDFFVQTFKFYEKTYEEVPAAEQMQSQTIMPWVMYAGMIEEDLKAIHAYLQSIPAIENEVKKKE